MKVIIAGSRSIKNYDIVKKAIKDSGFKNDIKQIVSGAAIGVDMLGIRYAIENNINLKIFKVTKNDWNKYGKKAGIIRNRAMGDYADALIAVWDSKSRGTYDMINYAKVKGLQYFIVKY